MNGPTPSLRPPSQADPDPTLESDARSLQTVLDELFRIIQFRDRDRICCHDVSVTQCYALKILVAGGPVSLNSLAEGLYLDKSTASRVASALEEKGYLIRRRDPEDGRALLLEASEGGARLFRRIEADLVRETGRILEDFDPVVRREMTRLLGRLAGAAAARVDRGGGCCRLR